jgi:2-dehydro-3-deoxyphosphooctonate aldolase (KDO 8-P synthase)
VTARPGSGILRNMSKVISLGPFEMGEGRPLVLFAGPDTIETEAQTRQTIEMCRDISRKHGLPWVLKCSFDKANRSQPQGFRGPGLEAGLALLAKLKKEYGFSLLTDVHETTQARAAAEVADVLQVPAFLCRQTDLIVACAKTGRAVNIKKGQFIAPYDMKGAVQKCEQAGNANVFLTERGASFGYNNLVVDMRGLAMMRRLAPVCFDATHSVQRPGSSADGSTGGDREYVRLLARAATAAGIDALFCEVHPDPDRALVDGPNSLDFAGFDALVGEVVAIRRALGQP